MSQKREKKKMTAIRIFCYYLRDRYRVIILYLAIGAIFLGVYFLYSMPLEPACYGMLLSIIVLLIVGGCDFWKYYQHHIRLFYIAEKIKVDSKGLPDPEDLMEFDYQEMLFALQEEKRRAVSDADERYSDMMDYYTLWVHQIKTPISALKLLLQISEDKQKGQMQQEVFKIERYVEMVLGYLRISDSSTDFIFQYYPLENLVKQAIKKYTTVFIHSKLRLEMQEFHFQVLTDEKWLVFVIEQILSNALKYTREGAISIYMKPGEQTLVIEDTGIGIQEEDLPRVFERGYTGYNGHMDKKSTGIGLYLCKKIMTKLCHSIEITSQVGKGTKVILHLSRIQFLSGKGRD